MIYFLKKYVPKGLWQAATGIWRRLLDIFAGLGPALCTKYYCDLILYYNRGNNIIRRLKHEPIYEKKMCEAIVIELNKSKRPVFMDIGANLGLISAYIISMVPNVFIYAFEPGRVSRDYFNMTVKRNNLENSIKVCDKALGNHSGQEVFHLHLPRDAGKDGFMDTGRGGKICSTLVPVTTLDAWWTNEDRPAVNVVKIDTEGAELWVLQGGREFLKYYHPVVFLEIEPRNLRAYPYDHRDILDFFLENNYVLHNLDNQEVTRINFSDFLALGEDTYVAY